MMQAAGMPPGGMDGAGGKSEGKGNLNEFIDKTTLECLNQSGDHPVACAFDGATETYLQSDPDTDNQLLISVGFRQPVKISGVAIKVPTGAEASRPLTVKIFSGRDDSLDFDEAEAREATQELGEVVLNAEMPVKFVKFQNVSYVRVFVPGSAEGDKDGTEIPTKIAALQFFGQPCDAMNMKDWKPIKG